MAKIGFRNSLTVFSRSPQYWVSNPPHYSSQNPVKLVEGDIYCKKGKLFYNKNKLNKFVPNIKNNSKINNFSTKNEKKRV